MYQSNTTKLYYVFIVLVQHISILITFKMRCGIPQLILNVAN